MKSLKRGSRLITLMISVFIIGMIVLIAKNTNGSFILYK